MHIIMLTKHLIAYISHGSQMKKMSLFASWIMCKEQWTQVEFWAPTPTPNNFLKLNRNKTKFYNNKTGISHSYYGIRYPVSMIMECLQFVKYNTGKLCKLRVSTHKKCGTIFQFPFSSKLWSFAFALNIKKKKKHFRVFHGAIGVCCFATFKHSCWFIVDFSPLGASHEFFCEPKCSGFRMWNWEMQRNSISHSLALPVVYKLFLASNWWFFCGFCPLLFQHCVEQCFIKCVQRGII